MFGLGKNDEDQKFWNLVVLGFWGTDKEFENASPYILGAIVIIVALILIFA